MMNQCTYSFNDSVQETISIPSKITLLEALLEQKLPMRKACINGACGICLVKLIRGNIDYKNRIPRGLNNKELQAGYILSCIAHCKNDVVIQISSPSITRK